MRFNHAFIFGVAFCASLSLCTGNLYAQDELDNLLSDLESEEATAEPAEEAAEEEAAAEQPAAAAAEEKAVEKAEPAEEEAVEEEVTEEEVVEETVEEEVTEEPAAEEPADEESADEEPAAAEPADEEPADEEPAAAEPAAEEVTEEVAEAPAESAPAANQTIKQPVLRSLGEGGSNNSTVASPSAHPDADLISELEVMEEFRRAALDKQAFAELEAARDAMNAREWEIAYEKYKTSHTHWNDRPDTRAYLKECKQGMAEARYQQANQAKREGRYADAIKSAEEALKLLHPRAAQLIKALEESDDHKREKDVSEVSHRRNEEDYHQDREVIIKRLRRAAQLLDVSDLDGALDECDLVLRFDPYNREAIRLRKRIQRRRDLVSEKEFEATRRGMIAEVGRAWRPVYAVNSTELTDIDGGTAQTPLGPDPERTKEQEIERRMKEMELPDIAFRPPATIIDVVDYFRQASKDYDKPEVPVDQRGFNFVLQLEKTLSATPSNNSSDAGSDDFSASAETEDAGASSAADQGVPQIPNISASRISMWEALKLVCKISGFKFKVQGSIVMVMPKDMTTDELVTRSYNVLDSFAERASSVSGDMAEMKGGDFGGGDDGEENAEESQQQSWKRLFSTMGVSWPKNSQITYIKTIGKLRVTNTAEQLAILEQALGELNVTPMLIEIETRFVEVAQEDLNSLGFEWLLNSDYSADVGGKLGKWLNLKEGEFKSSTTGSSGSSSVNVNGVTGNATAGNGNGTVNGVWTAADGTGRNLGVNAFGGTSSYQNGMRYLSTTGNPIAGQGASVNDSFMRANAFIGNADLSMILHMLSQRSDTDLLSAPKVVTKSGQQAVIKVVTEYIYPQDYDVTISSSSSSSSGVSSGNGSSTILAMVEPQNFTMREVGVILDVTPEVSAEGAMINLELKPQVISEPTWRDYGMKVPIQKQNSTILGSLDLSKLSSDVLEKLLAESSDQSKQEYYTVPMEQPIFKVRAIDTHVSIYNGATVVMGGLITEERKSMDDKVPFLADIPYLGRLFRSRSEWSDKRNLLIFVTARLVDPRGRQMALGSGDDNNERDNAKVTPAPTDK